MKKLLLPLFISIACICQAQVFEIGPRAGANLFEVTVEDFQNPNGSIQSIESGERKPGFHAGIYTRFNLTAVFIQPEFLYTFQNSELRYTDNGGGSSTLQVDYSRFDIPLLIGFKMGPIRLGLGPVATFAISEAGDAFDQSLKDATYGYQLGLGIDIKDLRIEARYEGPFNSFAESVEIDGTTYNADSRSNSIILGIGINLL